MALDHDVPQLMAVLAERNARWVADVTPLSHLSEDEKLRRLGAVPPTGTATLAEREQHAVTAFAAYSPAAAAAAAPPRFDWRSVNGQNFVTPVRDQSSCGSCVAFGTIAAIESRFRIQSQQPGMNIDLSEAQLFYCHARSQGRMCGGANGGWWPGPAMQFLSNPGVADESCYPYTPGDQNCAHLCPDWQSRVTTVTGWHTISNTADMKAWISTMGPLTTCFTVYDDFFSYRSGVYQHVSGQVAGGHCVCVVGYDDVAQCWICKNSWGPGWGDNGFVRIGYGQVGIDAEMWAVEGVASNKTVLVDTAIGAPALANVNDTVLAIAWTGTDAAHHLNVAGSRDGGKSFGGKVILAETSFDGPGFTFGNGRAFVAWVGTDPAHHLNVISSPDCRIFGNKVTLGDTSRFGPALAFGNGRIYLAWVGTDPGYRLNVMSSTDGVHWANKVTLNESSDSSPALSFANGKLYLLWQGTDPNSSLNILESTNGTVFTNKVTLGDSTDSHPAMTNRAASLVLAWTGRDPSHHLNSLKSAGPTNGFGNKVTYGDTAVGGVALVTFAGRVFIGWTGTDPGHHLNVMQVP